MGGLQAVEADLTGPFMPQPLNDQLPPWTVKRALPVGHESLRADVGLSQATPHPEALLRSSLTAVTSVVAGYSWTAYMPCLDVRRAREKGRPIRPGESTLRTRS